MTCCWRDAAQIAHHARIEPCWTRIHRCHEAMFGNMSSNQRAGDSFDEDRSTADPQQARDSGYVRRDIGPEVEVHLR